MNIASLILLLFAFIATIYGIYKVKGKRFYFSMLAFGVWFFIIFVMAYQHGFIRITSFENTHRTPSTSSTVPVNSNPVPPVLEEHKKDTFREVDDAYRERLKERRDELTK